MKRFNNILFVANLELFDSDAFQRVVQLAEHNQAKLTVVSIIEELPVYGRSDIDGIFLLELQNTILESQQSQLQTLVASIGENFGKKIFPINTKVLTGIDFIALIQEVISNDIDLLIKTADEEGVIQVLFGSSDMHLLRKCPCPVWLIKPQRLGFYKKIMVAVDFDPMEKDSEVEKLNRQLIEMSTSLALSDSSELHIIHAWHAYGEERLRSGLAYQPKAYVKAYVDRIHTKQEKYFAQFVADFFDNTDNEIRQQIKPKLHLIKGYAKDKIPEIVTQQKIDLLIMGTVGRVGIPGFIIGNTAETVLNRINCSVLAIKPQGFISPLTYSQSQSKSC